MNGIEVLLNNEALLVMLIAPSMIVGMAIIFMAFKLLSKLGDKYIIAQDRQTTAFEKIVDGVDYLIKVEEQRTRRDDDIRISLRVITDRIEKITTINTNNTSNNCSNNNSNNSGNNNNNNNNDDDNDNNNSSSDSDNSATKKNR